MNPAGWDEDEPGPVAVLVVRAWYEAGGVTRARIWTSLNLPQEPIRSRVVGSVTEIEQAIGEWVGRLRPD